MVCIQKQMVQTRTEKHDNCNGFPRLYCPPPPGPELLITAPGGGGMGKNILKIYCNGMYSKADGSIHATQTDLSNGPIRV